MTKKKTISPLMKAIDHVLAEMKAEDVFKMDVREKTAHFDDMIVCTCRSSTHGNALAEKLREAIKKIGHMPGPLEGDAKSDWLLVDAGGIIIHIMTAECRERYSLETLWSATTRSS